MEELSDQDLRRRVYGATLIVIAFPPLVGGFLMGVAGYYPLPDVYLAMLSYTGLYTVVSGVLVMRWAATLAERLIHIAHLAPELAAMHLYRMLKPAPVYLLAGLSVYSVLGVLTMEASLVTLGLHAPFSMAQHAAHVVGAALPVLAAALPLFFYANNTLDRYFAPRKIVLVATSLHTKLLVSCLITPLLVDIMLVAYYTNRDGALDLKALWIWIGLLTFVMASFFLGRMDLRRVLAPLQGLIHSPLELARARQVLVPGSLDEFGFVTFRLQERIAKEDALRRDVDLLTERLLQAAYATGLGIFDHDQRNDTFYCSPDLRRIFGFAAGEDLTPTTWIESVHPEDRARIALAVQRSHDPAGDGRYDVEHRIVRRDGQVRWLSCHAQTSFACEGAMQRPVRTVGAVLDITTRVEEEARRRALETELLEARRRETVGAFASGIAHDFNNLLAVINGNLAAARLMLPPGHESVRHLDLIALATNRGVDLIGQISAFARGQRLQATPTAVGPALQESVQLIRATVPRNVSIATEIDRHPLMVLSGCGQLQQVICNLVRNAVQAIGQGGGSVSVTLRSVQLPQAGEVPPKSCRTGTWAVITVTDTGVGMTPETMRRIFEPFFTTRHAGAGTGLGLAVVEGIVCSLGGAISVRSVEGQGSTLEVWLPAVMPLPAGTAGRFRALSRSACRRLLYIEDDAPFAGQLARQLTERGWTVCVETSPNAALARLRAEPQVFDAVLTDYKMSALSGLQVVEAVGAMESPFPIAIVSGEVNERLRNQALARGALAVIPKSVNVDAVIDDIERVFLPVIGLPACETGS